MAETFFQVTNTLALAGWIALVLFPGRRLVSGMLCAWIVPGLLALAYACVIVWKLTTNGPPPGDVMTLVGRAAFKGVVEMEDAVEEDAVEEDLVVEEVEEGKTFNLWLHPNA